MGYDWYDLYRGSSVLRLAPKKWLVLDTGQGWSWTVSQGWKARLGAGKSASGCAESADAGLFSLN